MNTNGELQHSQLTLLHDELGRLIFVDATGHQHHDVEAIRAFPITDPEHGISIVTREGKELAWVDNIQTVAEPTRGVLEGTRFPLKSDEDVRRLADHRALVIDAHGVRYLIPDLQTLDPGSQRLLERYL
ncbi:MAG: DUF1854 domain-containing protein [Planctomycetes bacterium]|nr:DUF1854 domain-containing protein [Planctomycetota bacterium]